MNARLVLDAERYYRAMFHGRNASWNLRDTHMADTLDALVAHLRRQGRDGKVVVWAHNSHLGDARATSSERPGSSTSASSRASGTATTRCSSASPRTPARSPPRTTGAIPPGACA
jgi:hypothetical protein